MQSLKQTKTPGETEVTAALIFTAIHHLFCIWGKKTLQTISYLLVTHKRKYLQMSLITETGASHCCFIQR